jgi:hypothetical protein
MRGDTGHDELTREGNSRVTNENKSLRRNRLSVRRAGSSCTADSLPCTYLPPGTLCGRGDRTGPNTAVAWSMRDSQIGFLIAKLIAPRAP